ncbi:complex III assembly factor LYRM7 [Microplitis demolitor]|uniref:complex III assembly factor LYRM7 n=1 Tax=Microplitis demolitor TaxID=69319 RepID=UPI0004CD184B|nr:complex III assembly factor LYRM7 [Microplitis demolitor]
MSNELRREVLRTFKKLHRARLNVFKGDLYALSFTRNKINDEYKKCKNVTDESAINELNKFANEVEHEVRTTIIQAVETEPGTFELNVRKEHLIDNVPAPGTPLPKPERRCRDVKLKK